jgi:hypothetical protein
MTTKPMARPTTAPPAAASSRTRQDAFNNVSIAKAKIAGWAANFHISGSVIRPPR